MRLALNCITCPGIRAVPETASGDENHACLVPASLGKQAKSQIICSDTSKLNASYPITMLASVCFLAAVFPPVAMSAMIFRLPSLTARSS